MRAELKETEDKILFLLASHQGNPLEHETLIDSLGDSKKISLDLTEKVKEAEATEVQIDATRAKSVQSCACRVCVM